MMNKEKYQRTFSALHASEDCIREVKQMKKVSRKYVSKLVVAVAAAVMVLALASVAYAADWGGIRQTVQIWLHGEQTDAIMETENGQYTLYRENENGEMEEIGGGGGVAIDMFGHERPLTADELMEGLDSPDVEYKDDGTVWLYYQDQKTELTNLFDADGFCYVTVTENDHPLYVTVKYKDGFCSRTDGYATPKDF